jgi:phytanoyl-CoA hydroxylase
MPEPANTSLFPSEEKRVWKKATFIAPLDDAEYPEDLYSIDAYAESVNGFDAVDDQQIQNYHDRGYLVVENAYSAKEVQDAIDAMHDLIMGKKPDFGGLLFEKKAADRLDKLTAEERIDAVRKLMWFVHEDERFHALAYHPKLLAILEKMMKAKPRLYQDMAIIKPPHIGREKAWHQDHAYFQVNLEDRLIGVWIALDEATVANGCMHILPGKHREPIVHFSVRDWQICDREILGYKCTAVPLKPGWILFFDSLLPHGTPSNHSGKRRRALQYHYAPEHAKSITLEERLAIFGKDSKDVEC